MQPGGRNRSLLLPDIARIAFVFNLSFVASSHKPLHMEKIVSSIQIKTRKKYLEQLVVRLLLICASQTAVPSSQVVHPKVAAQSRSDENNDRISGLGMRLSLHMDAEMTTLAKEPMIVRVLSRVIVDVSEVHSHQACLMHDRAYNILRGKMRYGCTQKIQATRPDSSWPPGH